jgi:hypothetical protein
VAIAEDGQRVRIPPLVVETDVERQICADAHVRRAERLRKKTLTLTSSVPV